MSEETHPSTHPPLPPTTEDDRISWLRLLRSQRVGIATFYRLMQDHRSAQAALDALPEVARAAGVPDYSACPQGVAEAEWQRGRAAGARMVCHTDASYPPALRDIPDPPPFVWVLGNLATLSRPAIALVGARNASSLGTRMARSLAADLSEAGYLIVSGLARGIDTAAHEAALVRGTLAVMAGGVDVIYPAENAGLAGEMLKTGARVSEAPMGLVPQARHFPRRNRLVSGMAQAVVVVEAAAKSGSLITARNAADQGRDVLAVPGHPFDARAAGCNMLIRDGATLVRMGRDVIELLGAPVQTRPAAAASSEGPNGIPPAPPERRSLQETAALHSRILQRLGPSPLAEDQLIRDLGTPAHRVSPALVDLELDGRIHRDRGGLLRLASGG